MFLLVTPTGGRLWRLRYRIGNLEKLISLGAYPDVPLKRAREKRDEARRLVADEIDPSAERKARRAAMLVSFEGVAQEWLELQRKSLAPETISILGSRLNSALYPYLGSRPVGAITAQELLSALRRIEARGRHETAHRVRALAGRVFRYAVATGRAQHDIAADLRDALAPVKSKNFASVTDPVRRCGMADPRGSNEDGGAARGAARAAGSSAAGGTSSFRQARALRVSFAALPR